MYLKILICFFLAISSFGCNKNSPQAADITVVPWQALGTRGFSPGTADEIKICMNGSVPYVSFLDGTVQRKLSVMKYDGSSWQYVGISGFVYAENPCLYISEGVPYVLFKETMLNGRLSVMKFDGLNWVYVGSPGFSSDYPYYPSLFVEGGTPYIGFCGNYYTDQKARVMKFDGSGWVLVGADGFSAGAATEGFLFVHGADVYYSFSDQTNAGGLTVMKNSGGAWSIVGQPGFGGQYVSNTRLYFDSGNIYAAYLSYVNGGTKINVVYFNGLDWALTGDPVLVVSGTISMAFVISNSTPYVAYTNGYPERISVIHYSGSKWEPTGNLKFGAQYDFVSMAIDNGTLYTAYIEQDTHKASVMYFKP